MNVEPFKKHIYDVIGALHEVHHELGPGLNENCYQEGLELELIERGIPFSREVMFRPRYHGKDMNAHFKLDFLCKGNIIVECKSVTELLPIHRAQLFNYMNITKFPCGIIVNFMPAFAVIERYFYDDIKQVITTVNGTAINQAL